MNPYLHKEYFNWLCRIVGGDNLGPFCIYKNLLIRLFQTDFNIIRNMDSNRAVNGTHLRYYFDANRYDYDTNETAPYHKTINNNFYENTKNLPCSMLEMLIAFAKDIDVKFLYSNQSRLIIWFWMMIESMGLANMIDGQWDNESENNDVDWILRAFNMDAIEANEFGIFKPTIMLFPINNVQDYEKINNLWEQMLIWYNNNINYLENLNINNFINNYTRRYLY